MPNYYQCIIPRLNGEDIRREFPQHLSLVKKGIAGFIVFGGRLETLRKYLRKLQDEAVNPLIIASDLERGMGQQVSGGTHFPPPMALANAVRNGVSEATLVKAFRAVAEEARYAGINTIFAPVLDINTNPKNPIIATRSFGEDRETVAHFGCLMIEAFQLSGIVACGKHFPGHGDTEVDSHIRLPSVNRSMKSLTRNELYPFVQAIKAGVKMIMLGHLSVPAIDPSGLPVTLSEKTTGFLKKKLGFRGITITDAMNMGAVGSYTEEEASCLALQAGVDIILHPSDTEKVVSFLKTRNPKFDPDRLIGFRNGLFHRQSERLLPFETHKVLSDKLTKKAIHLHRGLKIHKNPFILVLDDESKKGKGFARLLRQKIPQAGIKVLLPGADPSAVCIPENTALIVAIFSETKAWKGGASTWLQQMISLLREKAVLFISFGSPYLLDSLDDTKKMFAYWDAASAEEAVTNVLSLKCSGA